MQILVDDLLVYNGTLEKYSLNMDGYQTVLFTENEAILGEEYDTVMRYLHINIVVFICKLMLCKISETVHSLKM